MAYSSEVFWILGDRYTFHLDTPALGIVEIESPEGNGPPPHLHVDDEESFYVLEGSFEVQRDDQVIVAAAGAFVNIPAGIPHTYRAVGSGINRQLVVLRPGRFLEFFKALGVRENREREQPELPADTMTRLAELAPSYGLQILG